MSLIAFRALNISDLGHIYCKIFTSFNAGLCFKELLSVSDLFPLLIAFCLILLLFLKELNEEYALINRLKIFYAVLKPATYIVLFLLIFLFGNFNANEFAEEAFAKGAKCVVVDEIASENWKDVPVQILQMLLVDRRNLLGGRRRGHDEKFSKDANRQRSPHIKS